jgi:amidase
MTGITRRAALAAAPIALAAGGAAARSPIESGPWPDATEIAARIRRGDMSALEAVQAAVDRAEALQPQLNFIVNSDFDRALAKARSGTPSGPFGGVPFLVKDLEDYAGLPTRAGSQSRRRTPPAARQGPYGDAFDRAGLIVIGKSATPEYGFLPTTEPWATGPTRNPWDPSRSTGGSSGGAAAAVAAGVVPFAHASDGGGSIRIPASCCGLFGLKPSRARMTGARAQINITDLSVNHVLTRSVRDSAALFAATEDRGPDARYAPVGLVDRPLRRRLRVGLILEGIAGNAPSSEVAAATNSAARLLETLGHEVTPTRWPMDGAQFIQDFLLLWASGARDLVAGIAGASGRRPDTTLLEPFTLGMAELAAKAPEGELAASQRRLYAAAIAYDAWFASQQLDVVLSPVLSAPPPPLGFVGPDVSFDVLTERLIAYVGYTTLHNVSGGPAMSVPLYWTERGLPVGAMFAARTGQERLLFELAYQLEAASPWAQRSPPVHA